MKKHLFLKSLLIAIGLLVTSLTTQTWGYNCDNANVYYDNSVTNWTYVQLLYEQSGGSTGWNMSSIAHTHLYYSAPGAWNSNNFSGLRFADGTNAHWGWSTASSWKRTGENNNKKCTNFFAGDIANNTHLFTCNTNGYGSNIAHPNYGTNPTILNRTVTVGVKTKVGSNDYSSSVASVATISMKNYTFNSTTYNAVQDNYTTNIPTLAKGATSTYTIYPAYTSDVTYSYSNLTPGYEFIGWYDESGNLLSSEDTYTRNTTADYTIYAYFAQAYAFIEGRFRIYNSARSSYTTTYSSGGNWNNDSRNIQMTFNNTKKCYELHTYMTPAEMTENHGTGCDDCKPYFYIKTSTSSSSLTDVTAYRPASGMTLEAAGSANGKAVASSDAENSLWFNSASTNGYVVLYFDQTKVWYELEYRVTYDANGGSGAPSSTTAASITLDNGAGMTPPSGKTFAGWNTTNNAAYSGVGYAGGATGITANLNLYAIWRNTCSDAGHVYGYDDTQRLVNGTRKNALSSALTGSNATLTGNLPGLSIAGLTSIALSKCISEHKPSYPWINSYIKAIAQGNTDPSSITFTIAAGYSGTLNIKYSGYGDKNHATLINTHNAEAADGVESANGAAETENNFTAKNIPLYPGTNVITFSGKTNAYISHMDVSLTNQYTITLDNQSATTAGQTSVTATYGSAMPSIAANKPEKDGYNFGGYFTETGGNGTKYYNADGTSARNADFTEATTLYAYWISACSATTPGSISKGTASEGTGEITLTASGSPASNNTWYWQSSESGTDKSTSGATKDVNAAGTYYLRSYCSIGGGCWSDAQLVTVVAADLLTPITPSLTYASTVTIGGTINPTLTGNAGGGTVSYSLNDVTPTGSLTINASTGAVTGVTKGGTATVTVTISANGNYAGGSTTSGTITVAASCSGDPTALVSGTLYKAQDMKSACFNDVDGNYVHGLSENGKFYVVGSTNEDNEDAGTVEIKGRSQTIAEIAFDSVAWLKGTGSASCRSIKFVTGGAGTLTVYGHTGKSKGHVQVKPSDGDAVNVITASSDSDQETSGTYDVTAAGTYYILSNGGSAAVYGIKFDASCTKPGTPVIDEAGAEISATSATLYWDNTGIVANASGYEIQLTSATGSGTVTTWTSDGVTTEDGGYKYVASDLTEDAEYTFHVRAIGASGYCAYGDEDTYTFTTEAAAPSPSGTCYTWDGSTDDAAAGTYGGGLVLTKVGSQATGNGAVYTSSGDHNYFNTKDASNYVTGSLGGALISSVKFAASTSDTKCTTYCIAFSSSATFDFEKILQVGGYDCTVKTVGGTGGAKTEHTVTAPAGAKSFALGRNLSKDGSLTCSATLSNSGSRYLYYIQACSASGTAATGITVTPAGPTEVKAGETLNLAAALTPAGAIDETVTWTSEYISFATVAGSNKSAVVTAVAPNTAGTAFKVFAKTSNLTTDDYYAQVRVYYEVTYAQGDHGTCATTNQRYYGKSALTLPSVTPSSGYNFTGWYNGESRIGGAGDSYSPTANIALTAHYAAVSSDYEISYDYNGGAAGTNAPTSGTIDSDVRVSAPTRSGYTFAGWMVTSGLNTTTAKWGTAASPSTSLTSPSTLCVNGTSDVYFKNLAAADGAVTLTALWHETCAAGGGGGGSEESGTVTFYCSSSALTTSTITNDNDDVTFTYSDLAANGSSTNICNVSSQYGIKGKNTKLITVTCPSGYYFKSAKFHLASFGGKETPTAQILSGSTTLYTCSAHTYTKLDAASCGDIFSCEDSISGFVASKYTTLTVKETGNDKNLGVLLLDYTIAPTGGGGGGGSCHYVTYDGNGAESGSVVDEKAYTDDDNTVRVASNGYTRTGYTFTGWNEAANGSGTAHAAGSEFAISASKTLYAQWGTAGDVCWSPADDATQKLTSNDVELTSFTNVFSSLTGVTVAVPTKGTSGSGKCSGADDGTGYLKVKDATTNHIITITSTVTISSLTIGGAKYGSNSGSFYLVNSEDETTKLAECSTGKEATAENLPAGTYKIYAKASTKSINFSKLCISTGTEAACVTPATYTLSLTSGDLIACAGTNRTLQLSGSEDGVTYVLKKDGMAVAGESKAGTGSALTWTVSALGTYTVTAQRSTSCTAEMDGEVVLSAPLMNITANLDGAEETAGTNHTFSVTISVTAASASSYRYQWFSSANADGSSPVSLGAAAALAASTVSQTFSKTVAAGSAGTTTYYFCQFTDPCGNTLNSNIVPFTATGSAATLSWKLDGVAWGGSVKQGGRYEIEVTSSSNAVPTVELTNGSDVEIGTVTPDEENHKVTVELLVGGSAGDIELTASVPSTASAGAVEETKELGVDKCAGAESTLFSMTMTAYNNASIPSEEQGSVNLGFSSSDYVEVDDVMYYKPTGSPAIEVTLKTGYTLAAGDIIYLYVTASGTNKSVGFNVCKSGSSTALGTAKKNMDQTAETLTYTIPVDSKLIGQNKVRFDRASSDTRFHGLEIKRPGAVSGQETTSIEWEYDMSSGVSKSSTAEPFTVAARPAAATKSLGTIAYTSSDKTVATVDGTGKVTIKAAGTAIISATLQAIGCFAASSTINYTLTVTACSDAEPKVRVKTGETPKCATASITLEAYDYVAEPTTIQWYRDGEPVSGANAAELTTTEEGVYTVTVTKECPKESSNSITVENITSIVEYTVYADEFTIKSNRPYNFRLLKLEEDAEWSITRDKIAEDNSTIKYDAATRTFSIDDVAPEITSAEDATITITLTNSCGGNTNQVITIHKIPETAKTTIAWIACGKNSEGKEKAGNYAVPSSQSSDVGLWKELEKDYSLTAISCYRTKSEKELVKLYSPYDLIIMTDYPNSAFGGKAETGYTNAVGLLIDRIPILSFEAFVAQCPNWGIPTQPANTESTQNTLTLLCNANDIFGTDATFNAGAAINAATVSSGQSLQGFPAAEAPNFVFIASITDAGNTYITCCERQERVEARMMVFGLNSNTMSNLTTTGKEMVKGFIEYLLIKDAAGVPDCSVIFDGGGSDQLWSNTANWQGNTLPSTYASVRIDKPCVVNSQASAGRIKIHTGHDGDYEYTGSVTVAPAGRLVVEKGITRVDGTSYTTHLPTRPQDLVVEANESNTGALIFENENGITQATVEMYSKSYWELVEGKKKKYWQYIGIPVQTATVGDCFYNGFSYLYTETNGWIKKGMYTELHAFEGIGIAMNAKGKEVFAGTLAPTDAREVILTYGNNGLNLIGNSWTAPIQIANFEASDFGSATATVYIFNTGNKSEGETIVSDGSDGTTTAGQWLGIPINVAKLNTYTGLKVIPAMQGFEVNTSAATTLTLDYDKLVRGITGASNTNEPLRAPRRTVVNEEEIESLMRIRVAGEQTHTDIWLLEDEQFTDQFDNGWEAEYSYGDDRSAQLYAQSEEGNMSFLAKPNIEGTVLGFAPSRYGNEYNFTFHYDGEKEYYLNDLKEKKSVLITDENEYVFTAEKGESGNRFVIGEQLFGAPEIATGVTDLDAEATEAQKIIYNDKLYIIRGGKVFSAEGQIVR